LLNQTLAERLRAALAGGADAKPVLLEGDDVLAPDAPPGGTALLPAAVLVPIVDRPEPGVILTRRSDALRRHAGQIAFPGGRIDPGDDGPIAAALREADEEIGLPASAVEIVGIADRYRTVTGFEVTPVVGVVPPDLPFTIHDGEVAAVFEVPLAHLIEPANQIVQAVEWQGRERRYFEITWNSHRIWGATAAMIVNLGRRLSYQP
jgi:8-oxo-dGTP pyrophosphatase MutT (NUDIX family)